MELWDAYDAEGNPLGFTLVRDRPIPDGVFHVVVEVITLTPAGLLLITLRHPDKPYGLKWETTGGSALAGEETRTAAVRELAEETGIRVRPENLVPVAAFAIHSDLMRTYAVIADIGPADIRLQEGETVGFEFVTPSEFAAMCAAGEVAEPIARRLPDYLEIIGRMFPEGTRR
jgi:8-oxo-dGTP pyrophosphatase MutT (NUDIX family)